MGVWVVLLSACTHQGGRDLPLSLSLDFSIPTQPLTNSPHTAGWRAGDTLWISVWWNHTLSQQPTRAEDLLFPLAYEGGRWLSPEGSYFWPYQAFLGLFKARYYGPEGRGGDSIESCYSDATVFRGEAVRFASFRYDHGRCIFTGRPPGWELYIYDTVGARRGVSDGLISGPDTFYFNDSDTFHELEVYPAGSAFRGKRPSFTWSAGSSWVVDLSALVDELSLVVN